jgi:hypothetical protein
MTVQSDYHSKVSSDNQSLFACSGESPIQPPASFQSLPAEVLIMIAFSVAQGSGYDLPALANVNFKCHHLFYDDVCNQQMSRELWRLAYADIRNVHPSSLSAAEDGQHWRELTIERAQKDSFWRGLGATDGDIACLREMDLMGSWQESEMSNQDGFEWRDWTEDFDLPDGWDADDDCLWTHEEHLIHEAEEQLVADYLEYCRWEQEWEENKHLICDN